MTDVTIFDALCGSGKTIEVKKLIGNSDPTKDKYLFITPFLGELHRIAQHRAKRGRGALATLYV